MLTTYVSYLLDKGLIERGRTQNGKIAFYRTSESGKRYLETYNSLMELASGASKIPAFSSIIEDENDTLSAMF
jgi:hypothetical protein